jgi:hypothetical protein
MVYGYSTTSLWFYHRSEKCIKKCINGGKLQNRQGVVPLTGSYKGDLLRFRE